MIPTDSPQMKGPCRKRPKDKNLARGEKLTAFVGVPMEPSLKAWAEELATRTGRSVPALLRDYLWTWRAAPAGDGVTGD